MYSSGWRSQQQSHSNSTNYYHPQIPGSFPQAPYQHYNGHRTQQATASQSQSQRQSTGWTSKDLTSIPALYRARTSIPTSEAGNFRTSSQEAIDKCTDIDALHVYHLVGSRDELLLLGAVTQRLKFEERKHNRGPVLIVVIEQLQSQNNDDGDRVKNVVDTLRQILGKSPTRQSDRVQTFDDIVLILNRAGVAPDPRDATKYSEWHKEEKAAIEATIAAIKGLAQKTGKKGTVWHNGTWLPLLSYILEYESRSASCSFNAITINGVFDLPTTSNSDSDPFSTLANSHLPHATQLRSISQTASSLSIPIVLLSPSTLSCSNSLQFLHILPRFSSSFPLLLPSASYLPTFKSTFNNLAIAIFRLRASVVGYTGSKVSTFASKELSSIHSSARHWLDAAIQRQSYAPSACSHDELFGTDRGQGTMHVASWFCDLPLLDWCTAVHSLVVSPGAPESLTSSVRALRCEVRFEDVPSVKLHASGGTFVLIPYAPNAEQAGSVKEALKTYWMQYTNAVERERGKPNINKGVANAWLDLTGVLGSQVDAVMRDSRTRGWGRNEKEVVKKCKDGLKGGGLVEVCRRSV